MFISIKEKDIVKKLKNISNDWIKISLFLFCLFKKWFSWKKVLKIAKNEFWEYSFFSVFGKFILE